MDVTLAVSEKYQTLLEPNLHDGYLLGIGLPLPRRAELAAADVAEKRYCITLDGVIGLHVGDFWEGNVMLDVTVSRGEQVRIGDLAPLAFAGQSQVQSEAYLKSIHDKVVRELLFALQLSPSCGCYLTAAFRTIKIYCTDPTNCEGANFHDKG